MSALGSRVGRSYPISKPRSRNVFMPRGMSVSHAGAGADGTMSNWYPSPVSWAQEGRERELVALRSKDLHASNPHAASLIDSISVSTVGSGLTPQSQPNFKRLGLNEEEGRILAGLFEWEFKLWSREAVAEVNHSPLVSAYDFGFRTLQNMTQMLVTGEFINIPLMLDEPGRRYSLALQSVDPIRMRTPLALRNQKNIKDGIRRGNRSQPLSYLLADPQNGRLSSSLDLRQYKEFPAMIGHRPGLIHRFVPKNSAEQDRGFGTLGPALKSFKDIHTYLDYELVASIVAANFPVWIEKQSSFDLTTGRNVFTVGDDDEEKIYYQNMTAGGVYYGNEGEKPNILESRRQGQAFEAFVQTVIRSVGAATGMPYEIVAKDFSQTNYSSARAAMLEAYKVFSLYQDWLIRGFLNMIWRMVMEEAVLREYIKIPGGVESFYRNIDAWTNVSWTRPKRGSIDPVKDAVALKTLQAIPGASTLADYHGEAGRDWTDQVAQSSREKEVLEEAGLLEVEPAVAVGEE